ncbi:dnaJ homolog subfamily C member 30, mitochondrial isoform 2-T2 [Clarias gariepinus]|uniref:dnaJ homolog subfamily C member 30, mitochondrial isoform X2 n=1 Tax=Clarias gariepinus TaxID=13013 RepID=UPI00234D9683|nr:dnaJ homolog subfamily C member 30, mitochondrial isoform X2 [Clarias gariepinus]
MSLWMTTPHCLPGLVCSKKLSEVPAVTRAIHSYGISPCMRMNVWRSYRSSSAEEIPLYRSKSAYYDILQVSPTATQAQIKTAYYKQSFIYHPDKNAGNDHAAQRFSQVSEAYSVLGNRALRKRYDAGILSEADVRGSGRPTATGETTSRSQSDGARSRRSPEVGARAQNIFDFDSFYRAHYGEQLQRQKHIRTRLQEIQRQKEETFQNRRLGRLSDLAVGVMLAVAATILFSLKATKG